MNVPTPATLPPADDRLFAPDALGAGWLAAGVVALVAATAVATWALWPRHRRIGASPPTTTVHDAFLHRIDELGERLGGGALDLRRLHHELARTLRAYALATGTAGADAMSVRALHDAGRRATATAVKSFEHPQFAATPSGDAAHSLRLARAAVRDDPGDVARHDPADVDRHGQVPA